jgi:hypothetical protein
LDKAGELALFASTLMGEELAKGFVEFLGDD